MGPARPFQVADAAHSEGGGCSLPSGIAWLTCETYDIQEAMVPLEYLRIVVVECGLSGRGRCAYHFGISCIWALVGRA